MDRYPELHMMIAGERTTGGSRAVFPVINPATGERLADLPLATKADLDQALAAAARKPLHFGLRINPQQSEGAVAIYDPSAPGSRLGVIRGQLRPESLDGITGLHFHNLCEQDVAPLRRTSPISLPSMRATRAGRSLRSRRGGRRRGTTFRR